MPSDSATPIPAGDSTPPPNAEPHNGISADLPFGGVAVFNSKGDAIPIVNGWAGKTLVSVAAGDEASALDTLRRERVLGLRTIVCQDPVTASHPSLVLMDAITLVATELMGASSGFEVIVRGQQRILEHKTETNVYRGSNALEAFQSVTERSISPPRYAEGFVSGLRATVVRGLSECEFAKLAVKNGGGAQLDQEYAHGTSQRSLQLMKLFDSCEEALTHLQVWFQIPIALMKDHVQACRDLRNQLDEVRRDMRAVLALKGLSWSDRPGNAHTPSGGIEKTAPVLGQPASAELAQPAPKPTVNEFRRDGGMWRVQFKGTGGTFPKLKGMKYIAMLLGRRDEPKGIDALELVGSDPLLGQVHRTSQPVIAKEDLDQYREDAADLGREIEDARAAGDAALVESLRGQQAHLLDQIGRATGLGVRIRDFGDSSPRELARIGVSQAIKRAYQKFRDADPSQAHLSEHLKASIRCENGCFSYRPPAEFPGWSL